MWIKFEPDFSDEPEMAIPYGNALLKMARGISRDIADPIAKRLLEHSPELYKAGEAPKAVPVDATPAPAAPAGK